MTQNGLVPLVPGTPLTGAGIQFYDPPGPAAAAPNRIYIAPY